MKNGDGTSRLDAGLSTDLSFEKDHVNKQEGA